MALGLLGVYRGLEFHGGFGVSGWFLHLKKLNPSDCGRRFGCGGTNMGDHHWYVVRILLLRLNQVSGGAELASLP